MRLAAQERMGYYPAATEAISKLIEHLTPSKPESTYVLDPCAGEGAAIRQIAEALAVPHENVYCIELDHGRGDAIREAIPDATVLSPCSFFSTSIMPASFGLVYCNPPFDHQLGGGGREEMAFFRECYRLLARDGILVAVAPFSAFRNHEMSQHLDCFYKEAALYKFPDGHRPYHECVFIGVKRNNPIGGEQAANTGLMMSQMHMGGYYGYPYDERDIQALGERQAIWSKGYQDGYEEDIRAWSIPECRRPLRFLKAGYTDQELIEAVSASPINGLVLGIEEPPMREPPLPLERGHVAMLLAAGALDGLVEVAGGDNHVVRGVATKVEVYNEEASDYQVSEDGKTARIKEVYSQQITLKVRAMDRTGTIYTFAADSATKECEDAVEQHEVGYQDWELIQALKRRTQANGCTPGEEAAARAKLKVLMERIQRDTRRKTGS